MANMAWACAALGFNSLSLFEAIESRAVWLVENGTEQAVSNTAWASAKLGHEVPSLSKVIELRGA